MSDRGSAGNEKRDRFDPRFDPAFQPGYDPRNDPTIAARSGSRFGTPPAAFRDPSYDVPPAAAPPAPFLPPARTSQSTRGGADTFGPDAFGADAFGADALGTEGFGADAFGADGSVRRAAGTGGVGADRYRTDRLSSGPRYAPDGTRRARLAGERAAEREGDSEGDTATAKGVNPFVIVLWIASAVFVFSGVLGLRALPGIELAASTSAGSSYFILQVYAYGYPLLIMLGLATAVGLLFLHAARWSKRAPAREPAD